MSSSYEDKFLDEFDTSISNTKIIANKGGIWRGVEPDSLEAYKRAIDAGVDGIKVEARALSGGYFVGEDNDPVDLKEVVDYIPEDITLVIDIEHFGGNKGVADVLDEKNKPWQIVSFNENVIRELVPSYLDHAELMLGNPFTKELSWKDNLKDLKQDLFPKQKILDLQVEKIIVADSLARFGVLSRTYKRLNHSVWGANGQKAIRKHLLDPRVKEIYTDHPVVALEIRAELSQQHK